MSGSGPYLREGSVVTAANPPLPLETVLVNFMRLADSVDTADLVTIADELAAGLDGAAPHLRAVVDNGLVLLSGLRANQPRLSHLLANVRGLTSSGSSLPSLAATVRSVTDEVRAATPDLARLIDSGATTGGDRAAVAFG